MAYIGIDLGTTYSAVSVIDQYGKATILPTPSGERLTPSAVYIGGDGTVLVGAEAKDMLQDEPDNVATFFKRYMGDSDYAFYAGEREYSAADLQAILLEHLRRQAEQVLGEPVRDAVITVPAYFNDLQRNQTVDAGRRAGLNVLRIINEPTSAAICYGLGQGTTADATPRRMMVYDLGGGTFDVTVLEVSHGGINVLATGGDHHLGGKDWDDMLIDYVAGEFRQEHGSDPREDFECYSDLLYNIEKLKIQLSSRESASIVVRSGGNRSRVTVTRDKFEEITRHLMSNTQSKAAEVLAEAGLQWSDLEGVLLVGGSTKMPMVENWVRQFSGKEPLRGINVDEAVCLGAVLQARIELESHRVLGIGGGRTQGIGGGAAGGMMRIRDVMSHSLGAIAVSDDGSHYVNSIIIGRNKPIPVEERRPFRHHTRPDGPNELEVYLTQGETREVQDVVVIGRYMFHDFAHVPSGETIIDIGYSYDTNGIVQVSGYQRETGMTLVPEKLPLPEDMTWLYGRPQGGSGRLSVVITIDVSYSMMGKPLSKAQDAAREFVRNINLNNAMVAIHAFSDTVQVMCDLTNDERTLTRAIGNMSLEGANLANPLKQATEVLEPQLACSKPVMIVLTDGMWTSKKNAIKTSDHCRAVGIDIIALGFGGADEEFLKRISTISSMTDLDHVVEQFGTIAQELNSKLVVSR